MNFKLGMLGNNTSLRPTLVEWYLDGWPDRFSRAEAEARLDARMNLQEIPLALVLFDDDQPVGTVSLVDGFGGVPSELGPWLSELYVAPEHRGKGTAELLAMAAARVAWSAGADMLYVVPDESAAIFEGAGWEPFDLPGAPPEPAIMTIERPEEPPSFYDLVGGDERVRALVDRFYDLMDELPETAEIRDMHARSLKASRQKLYEFLSGWMGGPNLYIEKHGHPRLRMRHMPFEIGTDARDQWLRCMDQALDEVVEDEEVREQLKDSFAQIADHMRNRRGP